MDILVSLHFGTLIRPWFKNVNKSLHKEPKWFLHDYIATDPFTHHTPIIVPARTLLSQLL